jgi:hypothetical protein
LFQHLAPPTGFPFDLITNGVSPDAFSTNSDVVLSDNPSVVDGYSGKALQFSGDNLPPAENQVSSTAPRPSHFHCVSSPRKHRNEQ